ncbi:tctex1 domain-containing protein 3 [Electrophorus electricus]|uniref:tctex1 domain-containing protein 3 n=1 Tax=Electrophorus electricus TaxID=8005 RepID=UPI0015D00295|nr:tctex1 domain-containing protein 3 [Electrophorus electricus]
MDVGKTGVDGAVAKNPFKQRSRVRTTGHQAKLANTYRLRPVRRFVPHLIHKKGEELMGSFGDMTYKPEACGEVAIEIADRMVAFIKAQAFDRYRCVVEVTVMEKQGQAVKMASRALWDSEKDTSLTLKYENKHLLAVGVVFALYLD